MITSVLKNLFYFYSFRVCLCFFLSLLSLSLSLSFFRSFSSVPISSCQSSIFCFPINQRNAKIKFENEILSAASSFAVVDRGDGDGGAGDAAGADWGDEVA